MVGLFDAGNTLKALIKTHNQERLAIRYLLVEA